MVAATTAIATVAIGARIHFSTDLDLRARRRYSHIIEIIIQSSTPYSIAVLLEAIINFLSISNSLRNEIGLANGSLYVAGFMIFITVRHSMSPFSLPSCLTVVLAICTYSYDCTFIS